MTTGIVSVRKRFSPSLTFGQLYPLSCPIHICFPMLPILYPDPPVSLLLLPPLPFLRKSGHHLYTTEHIRVLFVVGRLLTYRILEGDRNRVL